MEECWRFDPGHGAVFVIAIDGNVVLEAQASGLGVVAYDEAAAGLHIRHGYNGVLAMPGDEYAWIEAAC